MNSNKQLSHSWVQFTTETVRASFWLGVLAFLLCLPQSQAAVGDTFTDDNFKYTVLTEKGRIGTVSVAKQSPTIPSGAVTIPSSIIRGSMTYNVTSIATTAFGSCRGLTSITIPNSVTSIGVAAFASCVSLANITISDSVTDIGGSAFAACSSLVSITIPDSVTNIGRTAFTLCSNLTSVVIGKSLTSMGDKAFQFCTSLTNVYFKGNAPSTGSDVFYACPALETIYYVEGTTGWTNPWQGIATATWAPEPEPTVPELAYAVEGSKLVLRWAASSGAMLEVSFQADDGLWTHAGAPEVKEGTCYYEAPIAPGAAYYRLVIE